MRILLTSIFFLAIRVAFSQLITLPDQKLIDKLNSSYQYVMVGNQLDAAKAALVTGPLDLRFAGIVDATGVEYFKSINTLDLGNNQLTNVPSLLGITGLVNFYASNNNLTSLPSMATLHLKDFQVVNNKLTALPDLSGSTGLLSLYCNNNNLTQFPSLINFPQLSKLVTGQNPISASFIDVTPCIHLTELHVHRTGIDTIIGLEKLTSLTTLYAWTNNIKSFKALDNISTLTLCVIFDNPFSDMPNMQNKTGLSPLNVYGALLTFEDIQPVLQNNPPATFIYSPQRAIPFADVTARAENNYTLSYPVASPLPTNIYVWMKNGIIIDSSASPSYTFSPLKSTDAGTYQLKVYNTSITTLTLNTNTFNIAVLPCIELNIPNVDIVSKDCSKGYTIDFSQNQISGGTAPFTYELVTSSTRKNITYPLVENVEAGNYFLRVLDSKLCSATDDFILNRIDNCDPVLTPNGDGIADTYYIENKGKVTVYNLQRVVVNTLQAPIVWDGTDRNGALLDAGFYILITEGAKPVYLTIIR
ncbi:glycoprotein [Cytophaga aurantiaca]|uniref:glycoprotein n=1 Tax=Cytophaga aurantiaca TaxID=29530 RepID=UPI0003A8B384|nr:glycoprotein [Cytophaga aurantiaca]